MAPQTQWLEKDYYRILGVSSTATDKEITRAYRKLAKKHHPDATQGDDSTFKEISSAYDVLSDTDQRREYDEIRRTAAHPRPTYDPGFSTGPGHRTGGFPDRGFGPGVWVTSDDLGDLGDLDDLWGSVFRGTPSSHPPARGSDLEAELTLSFIDAVRGTTTTLTLNVEQPCPSCQGTGTRGAGPCPTCNGRGQSVIPRTFTVRIPAGVESGQRIRIPKKGSPGPAGTPPGDLFVRLHVHRHPTFGRRGADLTITVPVSFTEAALGTSLTVPTLTTPVILRIPPGTASGKTLRAKGHGVPAHGASPAGDLLVTLRVEVPDALTDPQRQLLTQLDAVLAPPDRSLLVV